MSRAVSGWACCCLLPAIWMLVLSALALPTARAQQSSISTWDAADFRIWGFVPYWSGESGTSVVGQLNAMSTAGTYNHVSDVIYFGGVRPTATGGLSYHSTATQSLNTIKTLSGQHGFRLHMSMFDVSGGTVDDVWTSIVSNSAYRSNFVNNVTNLLQTYNMDGFNFDWERPAKPDTPYAIAVANWGDYTQLARELGNVIRPLGMEISVCDYGSTDTRWDDSSLFDARVYDQLFIMIYHLGDSPSNTYANQKLNLTQQGAEKAFQNEQLTLGIGTYGKGVDPDGTGPLLAPSTVTLRSIVATHPDLPYNSQSITATVADPIVDVNGTSRTTGTWNIESRQQVREKTQLALDRNMPGMFSWTIHYDARNELGLHRVMHHYLVFKRGIPDLNLDGKVNATDANNLANNMGTVPGWTGTNTAARLDNFYLRGNWEKGDRDGNGFVNQQDADWLAGRFAALGVNLPDRLAYSGTFENFQNSRGVTGRWRAKREAGGNLRETGNFAQHGASGLTWTGSGVGAEKRSTHSVTLRNQNSAEAFDDLNKQPRMMNIDLVHPIDLATSQETYFTFLVRQNTAPLLSAQLSSNNRTLSLEFLNSAGVNQFDFSFRGLQQQFAINSQADVAGQDVSAGGFAANTTYLLIGKIAGNGSGANTMQATLFASGATVGNYAHPNFQWMLTAQSSAGYNPTVTQLQFTSLYEANYTVSNVWVGTAADLFALPSAAMGDFNIDGLTDAADYVLWRKTMDQSTIPGNVDGNGNGMIDSGDYATWMNNFGRGPASGASAGEADVSSSSSTAVPEPAGLVLAVMASIMGFCVRRR